MFVWQFSVTDKMSFVVAQMVKNVKNMPAMQETQTSKPWFLGQEDPLENGMTIHSNILPWEILWTEKPDGFHGVSKEWDMT